AAGAAAEAAAGAGAARGAAAGLEPGPPAGRADRRRHQPLAGPGDRAGPLPQDLYYRLAVVDVVLPPLRERPDDIPLLIEHLVRQVGGPQARLPDRVIEALRGQSYSGNVRELRNAVARAL